MFTRHIFKGNDAAAIEAAIQAGQLASPYIAFNVQSNTTNLVIPADKEPASIEYEQEPSEYITFNSASVNMFNEAPYLNGNISFNVNINSYPEEPYTYPAFAIVPKSDWDARVEAMTNIEKEIYPTDEEVVETFLNPNNEHYNESLIAEIVEKRRALPQGELDCIGSQTYSIPYSDSTEEIEDWEIDRHFYLLGGFYNQSTDSGSPYMYILDVYELQNHLINDDDYAEETLIIECAAEVYPDFDNRTIETWAGMTQNNVDNYSHLGVGVYLTSQFENFYDGESDYDEAIADFLDEGHMLTFEYDADTSSGFYNKIETFSMSDLEGFNPANGDEICIAVWNIDDNGDRFDLIGAVNSQSYEPLNLLWYEDVDWSSEDELDEKSGEKIVDFTRFVPDASLSVEAALEDIWNSNWNKIWNACVVGEPDAHAALIVNPVVDTSDGEFLYGGRVVDAMYGADGDTRSVQFYDCSIGASDTFYIACYWDEDYPQDYVLIGPLTGESIDSINVEFDGTQTDSTPPSSVVITPMDGGDSSTDVSLGYKFTVGQDNTAYFNTGYVPNTDTVVQIKGIMKKSGDGNEHGMGSNTPGVYQFGVFGFHYPFNNTIYFDHEAYYSAINAELNDVDSSVHEYEFGNYYIKVDGTQVASGTPIQSTNDNNKAFYIFASNNMDSDSVRGYAPVGSSIEYVKFLEPDGNGGLELMADFRPGIIWPDETKVLKDLVSGDIIYPDGVYNAIEATEIEDDDTPDSSTSSTDIIAMYGNPGNTPTTENPFVTFTVDASIDALSNWDHMEVGIYSLNHYENNGYSSINSYRWNGFIKTCTIALTDGTAHYSIQTADDLDCNEIPAGDGYTFTGYDDTICVVAWFSREYQPGEYIGSDEIFELCEYELPSGL